MDEQPAMAAERGVLLAPAGVWELAARRAAVIGRPATMGAVGLAAAHVAAAELGVPPAAPPQARRRTPRARPRARPRDSLGARPRRTGEGAPVFSEVDPAFWRPRDSAFSEATPGVYFRE
jgi:hypothetical protein